MVHAILVCTHEGCTETYEAYGTLAEIEALACECGCCLEVVCWPDPLEADDGPAGVELLPVG